MSSTLDNWDNGNHHMRDGYFTGDLLCARSAVSFIIGRTEVLEGMTEVTTKTIYMSARNHERMCDLLCVLAQDVFTACKGVMAGRFLASVESSEPADVANVIQQSLDVRDKMASCISALKDEGWDASVLGVSSYASNILVSNGNRSAVLYIPHRDGIIVYGKNYRSVANTLARCGIVEDCRKDSFDSRHIHKFI